MSNSKKLLALLIIAVAVVLAVSSVWNDSLIVDEIPHIGSGYSYLMTGDYRLNAEHPPLAKDLAAIPLAFLRLNQNIFETSTWLNAPDDNGQWEFGRKLIYNSDNDATLITHLVKLPMLIFFILSAILIFRWAYELYGNWGAFVALILFAFSPTVLAHSRFVTTDGPALFGILYATYFFLKYLKVNTRRNFLMACIFFGIALLTKFSTFLLVPFFVLIALIYGWHHPQPNNKLKSAHHAGHRSLLVMIVGFIVVVWPVYFFHTYHYPPEKQHRDTAKLLGSFGKRYLAEPVVWLSDKPILRAAGQYGLGLLMVTQRSAGGNTTYFLGEVSRFGWHKYFPIVYFIKEPLAWWGLVVLAILVMITKVKTKSEKLKIKIWAQNNFAEITMLIWLVIYWGFSIKSTLNIGVRHLLPVYPFTIILVSGQLSRIIQKSKIKNQNYNSKFKIFNFNLSFYTLIFTFCILTGWYVVENLRIYPYYITYFNQVAGGPSGGYKYVVDSNLDWGQDLVRLSTWVKENKISKIETDYFGWADPAYYMGSTHEGLWSSKYKDAQDFKAHNQTDGWLAISATFLQGSQGPPDQYNLTNYLWLNSYKPVAVIGHSIFIYHIK